MKANAGGAIIMQIARSNVSSLIDVQEDIRSNPKAKKFAGEFFNHHGTFSFRTDRYTFVWIRDNGNSEISLIRGFGSSEIYKLRGNEPYSRTYSNVENHLNIEEQKQTQILIGFILEAISEPISISSLQ